MFLQTLFASKSCCLFCNQMVAITEKNLFVNQNIEIKKSEHAFLKSKQNEQ